LAVELEQHAVERAAPASVGRIVEEPARLPPGLAAREHAGPLLPRLVVERREVFRTLLELDQAERAARLERLRERGALARELEREDTGTADDAVSLPRRVHALDRQPLTEALHLLQRVLGGEVVADRVQCLPRLLERGANANLDAQRRSSGAYSSISRRSLPSSKRTVTTPSASMRVTIPVPSVWWRTASPVESCGMSARGVNSRGARVP